MFLVLSILGCLLLLAAIVAIFRFPKMLRLAIGLGAIGVALLMFNTVPLATQSLVFKLALVVLILAGAFWIYEDVNETRRSTSR